MIIAVNTRFLLKDQLEGCGYFIQETFRILAARHPEHRFYFLFDRPYSQEFIFSDNVQGVVAGPPARLPALWKFWYDVRVPLLLKKLKADVFVSPDGYASLTTRRPQCLVVHDLGFLHHPEAYKRSHRSYLARMMPRFLKKAASIATVSEFSRNDMTSRYRIDPARIGVVYNGVRPGFQPVSEETKTRVRGQYTDGKEFFIYLGALQPRKNLVNLLKAFSIFKKRQQSSMKLVLAGRLAWKNEAFLQSLKTYKYRDDVVLTDYLDEAAVEELLGAAYALVYPSFFEGFGVPVLEAMKCGVPALTSEHTSMQEIAADAGLYFNPHDHHDMADKLMRIYKDENLRRDMIGKGLLRAREFSWEKTASLLWDSILKASDKRNEHTRK